MLSRRPHRRRNHLARRIHQKLGQPFEDLLDLLRVRFLEVGDCEIDSYVADAARDFGVGL